MKAKKPYKLITSHPTILPKAWWFRNSVEPKISTISAQRPTMARSPLFSMRARIKREGSPSIWQGSKNSKITILCLSCGVQRILRKTKPRVPLTIMGMGKVRSQRTIFNSWRNAGRLPWTNNLRLLLWSSPNTITTFTAWRIWVNSHTIMETTRSLTSCQTTKVITMLIPLPPVSAVAILFTSQLLKCQKNFQTVMLRTTPLPIATLSLKRRKYLKVL